MQMPIESKVEYKMMYGLAVSEEAREEYSSREIRKLAQVTQKWYAKNAILKLNKSKSPKSAYRRYRPY